MHTINVFYAVYEVLCKDDVGFSILTVYVYERKASVFTLIENQILFHGHAELL